MNKFEQIGDVVTSLIERYGVTLCEVPHRFKEKALEALDENRTPLLDQFFTPLEHDLLAPIRSRAAHSIDVTEILSIAANMSETLSISLEEGMELTKRWALAMNVSIEGESDADNTDVNLEIFQMEPEKHAEEKVKEQADEKASKSAHEYDAFLELTPENIDKNTIVHNSKYPKNSMNKQPEKNVPQFPTKENKSHSYNITDLSNKNYRDDKVNKADKADKSSKAASNNNKQPPQRTPSANITKMNNRERERHEQDKDIKAAFKALGNGNGDKAAKIMMQLANTGNRRAQFHLGEFYLKGTGVDENTEKAKYWFTKSSKNGFIRATTKLEELKQNEDAGCGGFCLVLVFIGAAILMRGCASVF